MQAKDIIKEIFFLARAQKITASVLTGTIVARDEVTKIVMKIHNDFRLDSSNLDQSWISLGGGDKLVDFFNQALHTPRSNEIKTRQSITV